MLISDWSSDVCPSDLSARAPNADARHQRPPYHHLRHQRRRRKDVDALRPRHGGIRLSPQCARRFPDAASRPLFGGGRGGALLELHLPRARLRISEAAAARSEEHTSELQSLMRNSYAVFCLKKKKKSKQQ